MILDLKTPSTWDQVVRSGLQSILGPAYIDKIANNSKQIKYRDSEDEACELFVDLATKRQLIACVTKEISRCFKQVLTYHACRPEDTSSYYSNGILPLSLANAQQQFRELFHGHATKEAIETAISKVPSETRDGVVHVVLDDRIFTDRSGHYLIYGGEYQNCLAVHLPGASEYTRDILKKSGKATVFTCLLPFSQIKKNEIPHLVRVMMADHFFRVAHGRSDVTVIDFTLVIKKEIPANAIISHYCPIRIKDPFKHRLIWNDETMKYDY
jgi:hypothetical protein